LKDVSLHVGGVFFVHGYEISSVLLFLGKNAETDSASTEEIFYILSI